ncbi:uncharacterized protein [Amphiura filiformis]|uniref:uncharacterized protein n=1 Tax=Amphiura filiformis TaxID=82378 RepID=UPI003B21EBB7
MTNCFTKKANSTQAFLQRNIRSCPQKIKARCYTTLVRPLLEFSSAAWAPHHKSDINKLESVQRRAARFVMRDYHRTSSVSNMLRQLNWPTLQQRRDTSKLVMLYKSYYGLVDIPPCHLVLLSSRTRGHNLRFVIPRASILVYQHAFFPSTIRMWNALPASLVTAPSCEAFRGGLTNIIP